MALFQKSVLTEYLKKQDSIAVEKAYKKFVKYFYNPITQQNIRDINEEGFQQKFLMELFVNCFGYVINPDPYYNLTTEFKNLKDAKKADGAILIDGKAIAVIELKGTNTKNLEKCRQQAFDYKSNHPTCKYVITSNFEKLRFYIDTSDEFEEFNLFTLTENQFALLYLCVFEENLLNNIPFVIKKASSQKEEAITKKLYSDYSYFRKEIFNDLINSNPEYDKLLLFNKTQKLLDRFLFIFFGEDRHLIPANSIGAIINKWEEDKSFYGDRTLFEVFKGYFNVLNIGRPARGEKQAIFAYNGGLFADDEVLNKLKIDDNILLKHTKNLSHYDFESDVSVNILGHIFEHSLSEIEEIQNEISGLETGTSKRKKDGIFYTPQYITKYIVENTVGKLCQEKKNELDINEETYAPANKRSKVRMQALDNYRNWLLGLTICDPACGSGAFLNQALNFLIEEHKYIDELNAAYHGASIPFSDITSSILENNLYGVDINEESVEIAKLSLWLRTAEKGRKLTSLNQNFKCGNSLIDDPEIAEGKSFNWKNEFPEIFSKGGFDVIIGNPPYVRVEFIPENQVQYYKNYFKSASGKFDLSSVFYEKSVGLLNDAGIYSVITSYQFLYTSSGIGLREFIAENTDTQIIMFSSDSQVFEGATTYAGIFFSSSSQNPSINVKTANNKFSQVNITHSFKLEVDNFCSEKVILADTSLLKKIGTLPNVKFGREIGKAKTGVVTSSDEVFYLTKNQIDEFNLEKELLYPILGPKDLNRWHLTTPETFCLYPYTEINGKTTLIDINTLETKYPNIYNYLLSKKNVLTARSQGRKDYSESSKWYQLNRPREKWIYDSIKIIYPGTTNTIKFALDYKRQLFRNARVYAFLLNEERTELYQIILIILNSSLCNYLIKIMCPPKANNYFELSTGFMENFPFLIPEDISEFKKTSNIATESAEALIVLTESLLMLIKTKFNIITFSKKLQNWHELDFKVYLKELEKARKKSAKENEIEYTKLSLSEEAEWMEYFNEQKQKAQELKTKIDKTDKEIDQMVYELYGLTKEEIEIVENII
tara:strand:+ start:862 stop:4026 length:3165 start_codon:yes stop_codon:yes gene_type:complete